MIFSTAKDSSTDVPLSILSEHTFGVRSLAFSFNSQYLATLGDMNDGFLLVWNINLRNGFARLHYINKCTSFVRDMCWIGQTLITYGPAGLPPTVFKVELTPLPGLVFDMLRFGGFLMRGLGRRHPSPA